MAQMPLNFDARAQAFGSQPNCPATEDEKPQHFIQPKITGYRQLSADEATMMNEAKALGAAAEELVARLRRYLQVQNDEANLASGRGDPHEWDRLMNAEPARWLAMGRTDIQVGIMKIVRSIAQPAS